MVTQISFSPDMYPVKTGASLAFDQVWNLIRCGSFTSALEAAVDIEDSKTRLRAFLVIFEGCMKADKYEEAALSAEKMPDIKRSEESLRKLCATLLEKGHLTDAQEILFSRSLGANPFFAFIWQACQNLIDKALPAKTESSPEGVSHTQIYADACRDLLKSNNLFEAEKTLLLLEGDTRDELLESLTCVWADQNMQEASY